MFRRRPGTSASAGNLAAAAGFGSLRPVGPELALPPGFRYTSFGRAGTPMSDGLPNPDRP
ncbi:PhoX family protein [Frankia gtarii]|uniref:PhoX family protein n=1 Tax=Frankia gtarii TaxID=2950102 RepID=UPI0021C04B3F|nr:PhoX family protein [Frankia gtarii]